ncbi:hypothetical protein [Enterococcus rivorum]|uniref:Uncharacterized protein n=1 Tax=Enterococcus rivorum TaxID=762845 RepID=A0A1E5KXL6_9ENTE|nr:hypothetical protein [Enterococcus rivorum]MBP2099473.1 hypothetical protein [Enterococcus rivorum]OEH82587.1 hypothetical protein BCR26_12650 [Enterococcus rivorum]
MGYANEADNHLQSLEVEGKENLKTGTVQAVVFQYLPERSRKQSVPSELEITVKSDYFSRNMTTENTKIKVISEVDDKEWNRQAKMKRNISLGKNGEIKFRLSKDMLRSIGKTSGSTVLRIEIEAPLIEDKKVMACYDSVKKQFKIPVEVINHTSEEQRNEDFALVSMLPPTGRTVDKLVVDRGTTTDNYVANHFVKDLKSMLPFDNIEVVGFSEKVEFNKLGETKVRVKVKSQKTGVEGEVKVPVKVIEAPLTYVSVTEKIELRAEDRIVKGTGKVCYSGDEDVTITVKTAPIIKLKTDQGDDTVDLNVYKNNTPLKKGEWLTDLTKSKTSVDFDLVAQKSHFKKDAAYKGDLKVIFELP